MRGHEAPWIRVPHSWQTRVLAGLLALVAFHMPFESAKIMLSTAVELKVRLSERADASVPQTVVAAAVAIVAVALSVERRYSSN